MGDADGSFPGSARYYCPKYMGDADGSCPGSARYYCPKYCIWGMLMVAVRAVQGTIVLNIWGMQMVAARAVQGSRIGFKSNRSYNK